MRRPAVVLLAAVVLLLAGCSVIPTTGSVKPGTTEAPNGTQLVYVPNKPVAGASQAEIVSGFLTAASGGGAFTVAKEYLADGFAKEWRPTTSVLVQESLAKLTTSGADVRADIPISARVDANGAYTPESGSRTLAFHLVQERGQWRIDSAPNGIVLTVPVFQQTYQPRLLQFYDGTWSRLVSDRRWFPSRGDGVRPVVNALIEGPEGPLSGGVAANALQGAKLAGISLTTGGVTTVTLTTSGRRADATVAGRIQQQLVQSLGPASPPIRLVVDDLVIPQAQPLTDQLSTEAYVVAGDRFGTLSPSGTFTEDRTLGARIMAARPTSVTVSLRQRLAAVQTRSGAVAIVTPSGAKPVDSRSGLLEPTLDQRGWVYSVDDSGDLRAANGKSTETLSIDVGDGSVSAIQASPDGTRLLVVLDAPTGPQAYVTGILRSSTGAPIGLTPPGARYPIELGGAASAAVTGATWVDDADVAFLTSGADSDQVSTQQLGGIGGALGQFANVTSIVGTTSSADLRILVQSGAVYFWNGSNWQQQSDPASRISVLAVQR